MDRFKEKTRKEYRAWDIDCPYIGSRKWKIKLKKRFKKIARKRLKREGGDI